MIKKQIQINPMMDLIILAENLFHQKVKGRKGEETVFLMTEARDTLNQAADRLLEIHLINSCSYFLAQQSF